MQSEWNQLFYFTKRERRAVFIILVLILAVKILPDMWWSGVTPTMDLVSARKQIDSIAVRAVMPVEDRIAGQVGSFNVNEVDAEHLVEMGLSEAAAKAWVNYRKAIGGFSSMTDLERIYGIPKKWLDTYRDSMLLPTTVHQEPAAPFSHRIEHRSDAREESVQENVKSDSQEVAEITVDSIAHSNRGQPLFQVLGSEENIQVDINQSNVYQWQMLPGIGPVTAQRIINFRNKLGGFSSLEQVADTYGLRDSTFAVIRSFLVVSPVNRKLAINQMSQDSLSAHPYINWKQAGIIVRYREHHGPYQSPESLLKTRVFDVDFVDRLRPYLDFAQVDSTKIFVDGGK